MIPRGLPVGCSPAVRHPGPVLLTAAAAFLAVYALGVGVDGVGESVLMLNVLPIALLGVRFGRWAGLAAAGLGLAMFAVWTAWQSTEEIGPLPYLTHGVVFVLVGVGMGWYAEQLRAAVGIAYASEDRYRSLVDHAPEAIIVVDVANRSFRQVSNRALTLFGVSREQLERLELGALSPPRQPDGRPSIETAQEKIMQAVEGRQPVFEWTCRTRDGRDLPCEVRLVRLPDPERVLVRGSITPRAVSRGPTIQGLSTPPARTVLLSQSVNSGRSGHLAHTPTPRSASVHRHDSQIPKI